jgi:hypothetical protein
MKLFKTTQIYGLDVIDYNNEKKKKERVEGRHDSTQRDTRVKTEQNDATDVTSVGFETGQLRNSLSNFETWPKFNFGKPGDFETGPCNLAGSDFETGVAVRALISHFSVTIP